MKIISLCNKIGLSYRGFLIFLSFVYLLTIFLCIRKYTENWPYVLSLYAIYPYVMDIVQVRNTCALIFVYTGIFFIIDKRDVNAKNMAIFIALILVASFFHAMSIVILILILPVLFFSKEKIRSITIASSIIIMIFTPIVIMQFSNIAEFFHVEMRLNNYITSFSLHFENSNIRKCVTVIVLLASMYYILYLEKNKINQSDTKTEEMSFIVERMEKLNIILFTVVPLTLIIPDLYRIATELSIVFYTVNAMSIRQDNLLIRKYDESKISFCLIMFAIVNLYLLVLGSVIRNTVWYPVFYNNELL